MKTVLSKGDGAFVILFNGHPIKVFERVAYSDGYRTYKQSYFTSRGSAEKMCRK
jgi:hypothetical protein